MAKRRDFEERYRNGDLPWDIGEHDKNLEEVLKELSIAPCSVLELGAGTGSDAVWLSKKGFVKSTRGPGGGFRLTREPDKISLLDVIEAMEGSIHLNECLIRAGYCERDNVCPVHDVWQEAQERLVGVLSGCSLADLARAGEKKLKSAGMKKRG